MNVRRIITGAKIPAAVMMVIVLALALTGGVLAARAAISSANNPTVGPFDACYMEHKNAGESQGKLRIVSDPDNCRNNEIAIVLSGGGSGSGGETGPQGEQGEQGPVGPVRPPSAVVVDGPVLGLTMGTTGSVTEIVLPAQANCCCPGRWTSARVDHGHHRVRHRDCPSRSDWPTPAKTRLI